MTARRQVIVWWGPTVVATASFAAERAIVVGDASDADIVLPTSRQVLEPNLQGDFAMGEFVASISLTEHDDELRRSPRRLGAGRWSIVSAAAHLAALLALAAAARFGPTDPRVEQAKRVEAMQGYLARVAEHDDELAGGISSNHDNDDVAAAHEGANASASFDDPFGQDGTGNGRADARSNGMSALTTGRHVDDATPSDAKLARSDGQSTDGTLAASRGDTGTRDASNTPSRLAPKIGQKTALADSRSAGPRGRAVRDHGGQGGGSGSGAGGASSCAKFYGAPHDPNATWIEFELRDGAGGPVEGEPYRVTLPDGTVREGKTDARGLVCFTGIASGNAQIEWTGALGKHAVYVGSSDRPI